MTFIELDYYWITGALHFWLRRSHHHWMHESRHSGEHIDSAPIYTNQEVPA